MKLAILVGAALLAPASLSAQDAPAAAIVAPVTDRAILRTGTEIQMRLLEELTTKGKKLRVGQRVRMESAEPVIIQGVNVIPVGSPGMGELTDVTNKGMWGKSGRLAGRVLYLNVNGRQIRLSGAFDDKGVAGGVGAVAVSAIIAWPAGFFMTGTSAKLPSGAIVKAFVDEDVTLQFASATAPPLAVGEAPKPVIAPATGSRTTAPATPVKAADDYLGPPRTKPSTAVPAGLAVTPTKG